MYSIIISMIVYVISSYYVSQLLYEYLPRGTTRSLAIFLISMLISWLVGTGIDWFFPAQAIKLL